MSDFDRALAFVLRWEGGYVNDPDDPGGATNKGVTQKVYDAFRGKGNERDVKLIEDSEVATIYRTRYWAAGGCDALPWPISLAHMDACVNTGVGQANKLLARSGTQFDRLLMERIRFYDGLVTKRPTLSKFFRGWVRRVVSIKDASDVVPG